MRCRQGRRVEGCYEDFLSKLVVVPPARTPVECVTSVSSIHLHVCSWGCCALFGRKPLASVPPATVRLYSGHAHAAPNTNIMMPVLQISRSARSNLKQSNSGHRCSMIEQNPSRISSTLSPKESR